MGQGSSKVARKLPQAATSTHRLPSKPRVAPAKEELKTTVAPDGKDPQEAGFWDKLQELGAASASATAEAEKNLASRNKFKPAESDKFTSTLHHREMLATKNEELIKRDERKVLLPPQTLSAVVRDLQDNVPHEEVILTYGIDPSVIRKLAPLRTPKVVVIPKRR